jgi:hypothetical protein
LASPAETLTAPEVAIAPESVLALETLKRLGGKVMKKLMLSLAVLLLLFAPAGQALAVGLGGYLEWAGGGGEFEYEFSSDFDVDAEAAGFGFVLDTDLSGTGDFSYRLNVGLERLDLEDDFGDTLELGGLVIGNTFGFTLARSPDLRWWAGPQIRLGFYGGELESDPVTDYGLVSLGFGAVTGVNFMTGKACISTSLGLLATGYAGEADGRFTNEDFDGTTTTVFLNVALLFGN